MSHGVRRNKCGRECEVYSRVCGYHRPVRNWNRGKQEEFKDRKSFDWRKQLEKEEAENGGSDNVEASPVHT